MGGAGEVFFDWDAARSVEGYYRIKGSTDFCIQRAIAFAPYADCIWMETGKPILTQATKFAKEVRAAVPHQMLAYNLSPSFNWDSAGMTDDQMQSFIWDLAKLGFVWQFITLAGFHSDALGIDLFARDYAKRGMAAYVQLIQRKKCGHMGGKVLVSTWEHIQRLIAIRLQADVLNSPLVVVARTDAEAATMIDSNIDPIDHPHIKGATNPNVEPLFEAIKRV